MVKLALTRIAHDASRVGSEPAAAALGAPAEPAGPAEGDELVGLVAPWHATTPPRPRANNASARGRRPGAGGQSPPIGCIVATLYSMRRPAVPRHWRGARGAPARRRASRGDAAGTGCRSGGDRRD